MSNRKVIIHKVIIRLIVGLMKTMLLNKMSCFPELYTRSKNKIKVELDLSNYAAKSDLKSATGTDTSKFAKKVDLASLNPNVQKIYIGKLKPILIDLSKLSNVIKTDVVK